jgi:hypothetical protein
MKKSTVLSNESLKTQIENFRSFVKEMNKESKIIKLRIFDITSSKNVRCFKFYVEFSFPVKEVFLSAENVCPWGYLSPVFYAVIERKAKEFFGHDKTIEWNNSRTTGWMYFE